MFVLFDLDQTLVDSNKIEPLRKARKWAEVYRTLDNTYVYPGIKEVLDWLRSEGHSLGIVTSSPKTYAEAVVRHHDLRIPVLCAYHDTKKHKPHPDPIQYAINNDTSRSSDIWYVGDAAQDVKSGLAAGVKTIAAAWDCADYQELSTCGADRICRTVAELKDAFK